MCPVNIVSTVSSPGTGNMAELSEACDLKLDSLLQFIIPLPTVYVN
jgi:hypothetical protein